MLFALKTDDQYISGCIPKGAGRGGCGGSFRVLAHGAIWRLLHDCHGLELLERSSRGIRRGACSAENREACDLQTELYATGRLRIAPLARASWTTRFATRLRCRERRGEGE